MNIINKIALVTGGNRGLGKNMALSLAQKGINIVLTYNSNQQEAEQVVSEIKALGPQAAAFQLNVADTKTFDTFLSQVTAYLTEQNGSTNFDFLINNAGTGLYAPFADTTEEQFDNTINLHYKGVFF